MPQQTIKEISDETGISRFTLVQAAQRGVFGEAAHKSGDTWLIDSSSESYKSWLSAHWKQSRVKGK